MVATRTQSSGLMQLYINGALQASAVSSNTGTLNASGFMRIGILQTLVAPYNGRLDEVALYGGVLSQSRVSAHYSAGLTGSTAAPEPGSIALLGAGLPLLCGGIAVRRRRRTG